MKDWKVVIQKTADNPLFLLLKLVATILAIFSSFYLYYQFSEEPWLSIDKWSEGATSMSEVYRNIGIVVIASIGMIVAIFRGIIASRTTQIADRTQVATAFIKSLNQFSDAKSDSVKIGAIHSLAGIASANPKDYKSNVTHILGAYIRETTQINDKNKKLSNPSRDNVEVHEGLVAALQYLAYNNIENLELPFTKLNLVNIPNSKLIDFNLSYSEIFFSDLTGADLSGARLHKTHFHQTKLNKAILSCPYIRRAAFINSYFKNAKFDGSIIHKSQFSSSVLSGAQFRHVRFNKPDFSRCDLSGTDFRFAKFRSGTFDFATLTNADFRNTIAPPLKALARAKNIEGLKLDDEHVADFKKYRIEYKKLKYRNYVDDEDPSIPRTQ